MNILTEFTQRAPDSPATAAQQLIWANDGALHIADKCNLLPTSGNISLTATTTNGAQAYDIITTLTDFLKFDYNGGIHYYNGSDYTPLKIVSEGYMDKRVGDWRNTAPDEPTRCWRKGKYLYVYPGSASAVTNGLKVSYYAKPTAMTANGDDPFSSRTDLEDFHEGVVLYMIWKAKQAIGEYQQAGVAKNELNDFIRRAMYRVADDELDDQPFFPYHKEAVQYGPIWGIE